MAYFRCGGGPIRQVGGSVILASNPTITVTKDKSNQATITWSKPSSEVTIDHYNVYTYKSDTDPTSLEQFTLVTSISNQLTYTVGGLSINQTYYFVVTSVTEANYENASIKNKKSITTNVQVGVNCLLIKTSDKNGIYYSSNGVNWSNIYSNAGSPTNISYGWGEGIFYTESSTPKFSKDGKTWSDITGIEQSTPNGTQRCLTGPITYPNTYYAMGFRTMRTGAVIVRSNGSCETFDSEFYSGKVYRDTKLWSFIGSLQYVSSISDGKVYFNDSTTKYVTGNSFVKPIDLGNKWVIATNASSTGYIYYSSAYESIFNKLVLSVDGHIVDLCGDGDSNVVVSCDNSAYYSTDYGATWSEITDGIKPVNCHVAYDSANDTFIAIDDAKVYMCPGGYLTQWQYRGAHNLSGTIKYVIGK